jgi:hypothetical protein
VVVNGLFLCRLLASRQNPYRAASSFSFLLERLLLRNTRASSWTDSVGWLLCTRPCAKQWDFVVMVVNFTQTETMQCGGVVASRKKKAHYIRDINGHSQRSAAKQS